MNMFGGLHTCRSLNQWKWALLASSKHNKSLALQRVASTGEINHEYFSGISSIRSKKIY